MTKNTKEGSPVSPETHRPTISITNPLSPDFGSLFFKLKGLKALTLVLIIFFSLRNLALPSSQYREEVSDLYKLS